MTFTKKKEKDASMTKRNIPRPLLTNNNNNNNNEIIRVSQFVFLGSQRFVTHYNNNNNQGRGKAREIPGPSKRDSENVKCPSPGASSSYWGTGNSSSAFALTHL